MLQKRNIRSIRKRERGFTLLEILIVMSLLIGIIVFVYSQLGGQQEEADRTLTEQAMQKLQGNHMIWKRKNRGKACPDTIRDLAIGEKKSKDEAIKDAWGMDMKLECAGNKIKTVSAGADKKFGTDDDISLEF